MKIYFVRHAESVANAKGVLSSKEDDGGITEKGKTQCNDLASTLNDINFDIAYISPFQRTKETFFHFSTEVSSAEYVFDERLSELDYGNLHGETHESAEEHLKSTLSKIKNGDYKVRFGGVGENQAEFEQRIHGFLSEVIASEKSNVLVVSHSSTIAAMEKLLIRILELDTKRHSIRNCEYHYYTIKDPILTAKKIADVQNEPKT